MASDMDGKSGHAMLRSLSREVAVGLRDQMREVRHLVRANRHDSSRFARGRAGPPAPEIERLMSHAASFIDDTLTMAHTVLPIGRTDQAKLHGYDAYFAGEEGARAFRHDVYSAFKALMREREPNPRPVHEMRLARAHDAIRKAHPGMISALAAAQGPARLRSVADMAAATAAALIGAHAFDGASEDADLRPIVAVVLAIGLATLNHRGVSDRELLDSSAIAADSRHDRIVRAMRGDDPVSDLAAIFEPLLAVLP